MRKVLLSLATIVCALQAPAQSVPTFESQVLHNLSKEDLNRIERLKKSPAIPFKEDETFTPHDYSKGFFLINEDWYGHRNSTINHFDDEYQVEYESVKNNNHGKSLGCTNQFAMIWGDKMFCVSKQNQDPGEATVEGARFTVLNKKTMKIETQFKYFPNKADGRGCVGVNPNKVYVGTSSGILVYNIKEQTFSDSIIKNSGSKKPADLYHGQIGSMVCLGDYVYAVHQSKGLLIIDAKADTIVNILTPLSKFKDKDGDDFDLSFGSVVASKDGRIWMSVGESSGSGRAFKVLECYDPKTKEHTKIDVPEELFGPANSWYAWTPDGFCASTQNNVLYWNGGRGSWFSNKMIFKYDIDKNEMTKFIDLGEENPWKMYGCSFRVHPVTDISVMSQYREFGIPDYQIHVFDKDGKDTKSIALKKQYWFPSLPVFPDNALPKINKKFLSEQGFVGNFLSVLEGDTLKIPLKNIATDDDNMQCLISKAIDRTTDNLKGSYIKDDSLIVKPSAKGEGMIKLVVCSNGQTATAVLDVVVKGTVTGVESIESKNSLTIVAVYNLQGQKLESMQKGVNIVKYSDGSTKKIMVN